MLEDLQKHLDEIVRAQNNRPIAEFEGYSPTEMHAILHFTFEPHSPVRLITPAPEDYHVIPMLNQVKFLAGLIRKEGEIKLTKMGFLPTRIVGEVYGQGFIKDYYVDARRVQQLKEADVAPVYLARILLTISGMVKKRSNKISLTKKAEKILENDTELFQLIFKTYCKKYNWAFFDGYGDNGIGQVGFGFSLMLLHKYGKKWQRENFYAGKYFNAFPDLLEGPPPRYGNAMDVSNRCYAYRVFTVFMDYFGLIETKSEGNFWDKQLWVSKSPLFDKLVKVEAPKYQ